MALSSLAFALLAGMFSTLSPCVLPLLPLVLTTALSKHRLGPMALATGLSLSFVVVGLFAATIGFELGLDEAVFRDTAAVLMIALGMALLVHYLERRFALALAPASNWAQNRFGGIGGDGWGGQFGVGVLLGAVWSPCIGPTLGATSLLAAQGQDLGQVGVIMFAFGIGAAAPLLVISLISRKTLMLWRGRFLTTGKSGKRALGGVLILFGLLTISGIDKKLQTELVRLSPEWLTNLTTRF
jgi:cytochrome c-type biogenesis protein